MSKGQVEGLDEIQGPIVGVICQEVARQKKRLGGDFAVAQAVMSRDVFRLLNQKLVMI